MSSKKIYTTLGLAEEVFEKLMQESARERRSRSFIVENILRERFDLPWVRGQEESSHADKT